MKKTFLLLIIALLNSFAYSQLIGNNNNVLWGINGHPLMQPIYKTISLKEQFDMLRQLNFKAYRIDVPISPANLMKNKKRTDSILALCKQYNITLLPMVYTSVINYQKSEIYNESLGRSYAKLFCKYYPDVRYVEVGNELNLKFNENDVFDSKSNSLKTNSTAGLKRFKLLSSYIRGFVNELHNNNPEIKTLIDFAYNGTWYLKALSLAKINFDIIAPHFYPVSSSWNDNDIKNYSRGSFVELINDIYKYFDSNKSVWITEYNYRGGSYNAKSFQNQRTIILSTVKNIEQLPYIKALFFYELIDEKTSQNNLSATESSFGFTQYNVKTKILETKTFYKK